MTIRATITCYPDLSDHPGDTGRAWLLLEIGSQRIESRKLSAAEAELALREITRAFAGQIIEKDHGIGPIM